MGVPATLSSVSNVAPYIQYVASNGQTVYPYPFPITQLADLVVVINGAIQNTGATYSVSGIGNSNGGNATLNTGSNNGDIVTLYRNIAIARVSQIPQNSGFSSTVFNNEFNNFYLIAQQLQTSVGLCLQVPNTNVPSGGGVVLTPGAYANKILGFDANGNAQPVLLTSTALTQTLFNGFAKNITFTGGSGDAYGNGVYATRNASYSGGTPGFVNTCGAFFSNVGANTTSYEWTILGVSNNLSTAGSSVAGYFQGNRNGSGLTVGPTWGGVCEVRETVATANPTSGLVGLEVDNRSNGTDSHGARIGVDMVAARYNTSGAATTIQAAYRVQTGTDTQVTVNNGFMAQVNGTLVNGFVVAYGGAGSGATSNCFYTQGAVTAAWGLNLSSATFTSGAIIIPADAPISLDANGQTAIFMHGADGSIHFQYGSNSGNRTDQFIISAAGVGIAAKGPIGVNGNAGPAQSTGWGTPTGGSVQNNFAGGSASLATTTAAVAQIISILKAIGFLGT